MTANVRKLLAAMALVGGTYGCAPQGGAPAAADAGAVDRAPQVETLTVEPREFIERIEVTGTTEAIEDATLSAQTSGTVQNLVAIGTVVKKGQLLAQLDPGLLAAQVRQAKASVEAARASKALAKESFDRQKPLYEEKIISALEFRRIRSDLASAVAQLAQAEGALAQAAKSLANTIVKAPFDGVVEVRFVKEGEQVTPGTPIVRVTNSRVMKVNAGIPERYAADIRVGREASVRFNAYGIETRTGKLTFVGSVIDPSSRTFDVELLLPNRDGVLKPEMVARLLVTKTVVEQALVIPITSVIRDERGTSVYVVARMDGVPIAQLKRIDLGVSSGSDVVVKSGLDVGEEVVVLGQTELTRGDVVQVTNRREVQARSP